MKVRNVFCTQPLSWLVCKFDLIMFGMGILSNAHVGTASVLNHFLSHFWRFVIMLNLHTVFLVLGRHCNILWVWMKFPPQKWQNNLFQEESKFCLPPFVLDPHYWVWMWKQVQEKVKSGIFGALHQVSDGEVGKFVVKELCIQWWTWKCGISWKCVKQFCENITFVDNKLDGKFRFGSCCWECTML